MIDFSAKVKEYSKAIAAFIAAASAFAVAVLAIPGVSAVLPAAWITVLGIIAAAGVVGGIVGGAPANKPGPAVINDAVQGAIRSVGVDVTSTVNSVIDEYVSSVSKTFPQPARDQVEDIGKDLAGVVRSNVDMVVRGAIDAFKRVK